MGTIQLMFVFLSYILFSYFVMTSNQRTEMMLEQEAQKEMFDCMLDIGDLANEYYLGNTASTPDVLQTLLFPWTTSGTITTMALESGVNYLFKISGEVAFGGELNDPCFWSTDGWATQGSSSPYGPCNYLSPHTNVGSLVYNPAHIYEFTIIGTGVPLTFVTNGCNATSSNKNFTFEISNPGNLAEYHNSYSGFESPGYLINRPYCNISYEFIGDSVIIFTGNTIYDSTSYERICTPSNSMAIIQ